MTGPQMAALLDFSVPPPTPPLRPLNWVQLALDFPLREGSGVSAPQPRLAAHLVLTWSIQPISDAAGPGLSPEAAVGCRHGNGVQNRQAEGEHQRMNPDHGWVSPQRTRGSQMVPPPNSRAWEIGLMPKARVSSQRHSFLRMKMVPLEPEPSPG